MQQLLILFVYVCLSSCIDTTDKQSTSIDKKHEQQVTNSAFQAILDKALVKGAILIYDSNADIFYSNDFDWSSRGRLPASTFKIPNSIIALETRVIENDSTLIKWDGTERAFKMWEQDLIFKEAFHRSCVPCYQDIARNIGVSKMKSKLDKLDYGSIVFDSSTIDNFWLVGASEISQFQQISFLRKFYNQELPISERTYNIMKRIMVIKHDEAYKVSGKTGWAIQNDNDNGWFVGYVEASNNVFYFATNINPTDQFNMDKFPSVRKEVTYNALKQFNIEIK